MPRIERLVFMALALLIVGGLMYAPSSFASHGHGVDEDIFQRAIDLPFCELDGTVVGQSRVTIHENGLGFTLATTGLNPQSAYTVWWRIFGDGVRRGGGEAENLLVIHASGGISNSKGYAIFTGFRKEDDYRLENDGRHIRVGGRFINSRKVQAHFVIIDHLQVKPGEFVEQVQDRFGGDCVLDPNMPQTPDNTSCVDIQRTDSCDSMRRHRHRHRRLRHGPRGNDN